MTIPYNPLLKPPLGTPISKSIAHHLGLIGLWLMNEGSGDKVFDLSGNKKHGTLVNGPIWDAGKYGSAVRLSGSEVTEDHIDIGDHALYEFGNAVTDKPFSIVVGYTPDSTLVDHPLMTKADNTTSGTLEYSFGLRVDSGLEPFIQIFDDAPDERIRRFGTPIADPLGFHQFAATYDGSGVVGGLKLYVDGVINVSTDESTGSYTAMHPSSAHLRIGVYFVDNESYDTFADGRFGYAMIFPTDLSASQIARLYRDPFYMFKDSAEKAILGGYSAAGISMPLVMQQMNQFNGGMAV